MTGETIDWWRYIYNDALDLAFWATLAAIVLLICLSAFFSGSETALTSASRGKLQAKANKGDRGAASALKVTGNRERLIGAILLGNNLVNIVAASLATTLFTRLFGDSGVAVAIAVMTAVVVVFAEVMPKTYAIARPESASIRVAPAIGMIIKLFFPIVAAVQFFVWRLLRLFGLSGELESPVLEIRQEIEGTIALGHSIGAVKKEHRDRLLGALDLGDRTVEEIMLHRSEIEMIDADAAEDEVYEQCRNSQFTRLPVFQGNRENIVGVLHAKDVLREALGCRAGGSESGGPDQKLDIVRISMEPYFVPETTTLDDQMRQFLARHSQFALIVDEYGTLQGLVTLEDILEEIVGEITDEFDTQPEKPLSPGADGSIVVDGGATIRDLNREMGWRLPEANANTIAGLVIDGAKSIPTKGQEFNFYGFAFKILGREANRITQVRIKPL
ncbi:MAG: HlyC/CorC family transporter [Albidovulum sp.]|nr:HlyC/CorC family transporter [Albidovulum sp.]